MQDMKNRLQEKKPRMNSRGVNIMNQPQSKMRQLTQQWFFMIKDWKGQNMIMQVVSQA